MINSEVSENEKQQDGLNDFEWQTLELLKSFKATRNTSEEMLVPDI